LKTTAAVLREAGSQLCIEEIEVAAPRDDEVMVRLVGTGLCHTDLGVMATAEDEQVPIILGHEGSGVVEAVGSRVTKVAPGDHVVLSFAYCGTCNNCRRGLMVHCADFLALNLVGARADGTSGYSSDGEDVKGHFFGQSSFAGLSLTTERNCIPVPKDLPLELLGPLGCGIQTGAGTVMNALHPEPGSSIAVFATGSVGLAAILGAVVCGCTTIIAVDPMPSRRELALSLGATHTIDPTHGQAAAAVIAITGGGADYAVDCIGLPDVVRAAVECLASPGVCATVGYQGLENEFTLNLGQLLWGRSLIGVIEGTVVPDVFIPQMIELYRQGRFPFDQLIQTLPFAEINKAIEASHHGDLIKAVLTY
jgi:aryl-alcohol dehydrogenase